MKYKELSEIIDGMALVFYKTKDAKVLLEKLRPYSVQIKCTHPLYSNSSYAIEIDRILSRVNQSSNFIDSFEYFLRIPELLFWIHIDVGPYNENHYNIPEDIIRSMNGFFDFDDSP